MRPIGIVSREGRIRRNLCIFLRYLFIKLLFVFFWLNEEIMGKEQKEEVL